MKYQGKGPCGMQVRMEGKNKQLANTKGEKVTGSSRKRENT